MEPGLESVGDAFSTELRAKQRTKHKATIHVFAARIRVGKSACLEVAILRREQQQRLKIGLDGTPNYWIRLSYIKWPVEQRERCILRRGGRVKSAHHSAQHLREIA